MNKSRYSKNLDIYKVPSIKKNRENRNIKNQEKSNYLMEQTISTTISSINTQIIKIIAPVEISIMTNLPKVKVESSSVKK